MNEVEFTKLMQHPEKVTDATVAYEMGQMSSELGDDGIPDFSDPGLLSSYIRGRVS